MTSYTNPGAVNAVNFEVYGVFRTVFFGFPFETLPASERGRVMGNIIDWLCSAFTPDTTDPTVSSSSPEQGATVSGMTMVSVNASDDRIVDRVGYSVDSRAWVFVEDPPFSWFWDTTQVSDLAPHTVYVQAFDGAGNSSVVTSVTVNVDQSFNQTEKFAVVIGVSDYSDISDLSYCDEDASEWYNYLVSKGYDYIWVLGDGHTDDFPQHDAKASESNIKSYIANMVALADSNDWIAITFSGHGASSNGGYWDSYYCAYDCGNGTGGEDGDFEDYELVELLAPSIAQQIFVSFDSCYSGGMGDDLMAMGTSYPLHCNTTSTENGYGWDDPTHQMGAWTWQFLIDTLRGHYSDNNIDMENAFDYAHANYPHSGGDECMLFDSHPGTPFYLALPPFTPKADLPAFGDSLAQHKRPVSPLVGQTLASVLRDGLRVEIKRTHFAEIDGH